jgi:hypothetical protein
LLSLLCPFDPSSPVAAESHHQKTNKKTGVAEHPQVSNHVGLLFNKPPGEPGCRLFSHPTTLSTLQRIRIATRFGSTDYRILQRTP